tara:strand:- start:269 stop:871 length:603 start_codon:yes stop_codon:yes gene_type:complete
MRSLSYNYLQQYLKDFNFSIPDIFIETGTHRGGTIFQQVKYFKKLYTIELNKNSINYCKKFAKLHNINNIIFYHGESHKILDSEFDKDLKNIDRCIIFLDAHVTGRNRKDTSIGSIDVPVCLELEVISKKYLGEAIIIVDDARIFGKKENTAGSDWTKITHETVINSLKNRDFKYKYYPSECGKDKKDRLVIFLKKKLKK